jgi:hypothetical protein
MTTPRVSVAARIAHAYDATIVALDDRRTWLLAACGVLYFSVTALRARATPFWHDEIYTLLLSRLPSVRDVWHASTSGADLMPPLNLFLTRAVESLAGPGPVSSRLPAMIGFWAMTAMVFYLVRARSTLVFALSALFIPWYTRGYRYGYEARGYGAMLGLFALLVCAWSEAARGRHRSVWLPVFAITVAASVWNHYYGAVTLLPVLIGEVYRGAKRQSIDWPLVGWASMGALCCLPLLALMHNAVGQGATYWRHASWSDVGKTYTFLFHDLWTFNSPLLVVLALAVVGTLAFGRSTTARTMVPDYEIAAGVTALALPVVAVALGRLTGAFTPRYALSGVVGCALVVPLTLCWLSRGSRIVATLLLVALTIGVTQSSIDAFRHPPRLSDPVAERPILSAQLRDTSPVVVTGGVQFLQLWYYAGPDLRLRLWYIADPARAEHYLGADTVDRGFVALARWASLGIKPYDALRQTSFVMYDDGTGWLPKQLRDDGIVGKEVGRELGARVFLMSPIER